MKNLKWACFSLFFPIQIIINNLNSTYFDMDWETIECSHDISCTSNYYWTCYRIKWTVKGIQSMGKNLWMYDKLFRKGLILFRFFTFWNWEFWFKKNIETLTIWMQVNGKKHFSQNFDHFPSFHAHYAAQGKVINNIMVKGFFNEFAALI